MKRLVNVSLCTCDDQRHAYDCDMFAVFEVHADVAPLDRQVCCSWSASHSTPVMLKSTLETVEYSCKCGLEK